MMVHNKGHSTPEAEVGGTLLAWGQPGLYRVLQASQSYMKPSLKKTKQNKEQQQRIKDIQR